MNVTLDEALQKAIQAHKAGQKQEAKQSFEQAIRRYLLTGRRDLAKEVKAKADALLPAGASAKT